MIAWLRTHARRMWITYLVAAAAELGTLVQWESHAPGWKVALCYVVLVVFLAMAALGAWQSDLNVWRKPEPEIFVPALDVHRPGTTVCSIDDIRMTLIEITTYAGASDTYPGTVQLTLVPSCDQIARMRAGAAG